MGSGAPDRRIDDEPTATRRERPAAAEVHDRAAAIAAAVHGNPEGAIAFLVAHLGGHADDLEARLALARAQIDVGKWDDARATLVDKRGKPDDPQVVQLRVQVHRIRGEYAEAEKLLEAALKAKPDALPLRGDLLGLRVETGRRNDARTTKLREGLYDAYDASKAKTAADLLAVAQAALARGGKAGFHDANMVLEEAEALAPAAEGSWIADRIRLVRGAVFLEKYAADEAATTFGLLLERDPWHPDALAGMAWVHLDSLRFAAAARAADEALLVNPHHPDAHAALARIALIEGRRKEAKDRIEREVLKVHPANDRGLAVLAALAISQADTKAYAAARDRVLAVNPHHGGFFKDLSDILGFLHLYPEADSVLREGEALAPDDPYVQSALGLNLLRLGHEERGRAALEKSWKGDPFNERTRNVLDLYGNSLDKSYTLHDKGDLTIRLPTEDAEFVESVLVASVERSRKDLDKRYATKAGKLRVEFFSSPDEFSVRTVGVPSLGAVAVCFGPVITFIGPYHGVINLDLVIRHELAHVYAIARSKGRVPRWFTEGLSEWESELADPAWSRESAALLGHAKREGKLRKLSELELAFIRAESPVMMEVAYATAAYAIRYLGATYGRPKLIAVLDGYGQGKDTPELFREHFGKDLATVEREFEAWFLAELERRIGGWSPSSDPKSKDPRDVLFRAAQTALEKGDRPAAVKALESLVAKGGDGFAPRMALANLSDSKQAATARKHLDAARKFDTESIEPHVKLAEIARRTGEVDEEKKVLREALAIDADSLDPAARLLMLALVTDDRDAASYARGRTRALAPLHPITLAADALELHKAGKTADARSRLARATKGLAATQGKGPVDTLVVVALAQAAAGDKEAARVLAKQALANKELPAPARKRLEAI
ncbi:MAG TPA: tetratricopeptide repeat protein [Nannocystaceae bacterium]|nr:tetratricopeptide repeat protein [Nannocystaceae bacterium]